MNTLSKYNVYLLSMVCGVIVLFYYFTSLTPLSGDDWGFGAIKDAMAEALESYNDISGRIVSRILAVLFCKNKYLFDIVNAIRMGVVFYLVVRLSKASNNFMFPAILLFLILFVPAELWAQTYTWVSGVSHYGFPLLFAMVYVFILQEHVWGHVQNIGWYTYIAIVLLNLSTCLMMENIAAAMVFANVYLLISYYLNNRTINLPVLIAGLSSLISFIVLRSSPGANIRAMNFTTFYELGVYGKIVYNIPSIIRVTFLEHQFLYIVLFISAIIYVYKEEIITSKLLRRLIVLYLCLAGIVLGVIFIDTYFVRSGKMGWLLNPETLTAVVIVISMWMLYNAIMYYIFYKTPNNMEMLFFYSIAMVSNLVLLVSPIVAVRLTLFSTFFIYVVIGIMLSRMCISIRTQRIVAVFCFVAIIAKLVVIDIPLYLKTREIYNVQRSILAEKNTLYKLPKYSNRYLHCGEAGSAYHKEAFKRFYNLPEDSDIVYY
jgi:hypothetical protein